MRAIVTVLGKDRVGIMSLVCALLAFAVCCMAACELNKGLLQREKWRNKRTFPRRSAL